MTDKKEEDGRLVATTGISIDGVSYQKGEYVNVSGLDQAEFDYYVEQGIFWTESQWVGKYKEKPVEHKEPKSFPPVAGTSTTAQGAAATQTAQPALRREGDTRVESTTSGQTPEERKAATTPAQRPAPSGDSQKAVPPKK